MTDNVRIHYDGTHPHLAAHNQPATPAHIHHTTTTLPTQDDDPAWARYIPDSGPLEDDDPPIC